MSLPWLSTTSIKGFGDGCPFRTMAEATYRIEHGDDVFGSDPTRFGSIVHEVAERVHEYDQRGEASPDPVDLFDQIWRSHHLTDFDYYTLGRDTVAAFIDRTLFDREGITIATEFAFIIDLEEQQVWPIPTDLPRSARQKFVKRICKKIDQRGGVPVVSMIDRIDKVEDGYYQIFDYKTNLVPFSRDEVDHSPQLALYDMAVRAHWGAEHVVCTFDMLRHGRQSTMFEPATIDVIRGWIQNIWHQQKKWKDPEKKLNPYCGWCAFRHDCETYERAVGGHLINAYAPEGRTLQQLMEEHEELKQVEKLAKYRAKEFGAVLMAAIMENDGKPVPLGDGREIYLQTNPRYEYPMSSVLPLLQEEGALNWLQMAGSVSRPTLDRLAKGSPIADRLAPLLETHFVSPSLSVRKTKSATPEKKGKKKK